MTPNPFDYETDPEYQSARLTPDGELVWGEVVRSWADDLEVDRWGTPHDQRLTLNGETFYDEDYEHG